MAINAQPATCSRGHLRLACRRSLPGRSVCERRGGAMRRGARPRKAKVQAKDPVVRKSSNNEDSRVRDLEKRLAESQDQQAATSDILRVISSSPSDVQPVFDAIVRNAVRLCGGVFSIVLRFDGELIHFVAHHNFSADALTAYRQWFPRRATDDHLVGRAIIERRVMNVPDVTAEFRFVPGQQEQGFHSVLFVPMLREGVSIGVIGVSRMEVGSFPENQVELLKTFADQAVIAIENVRLFNETKEALEQQTATAEILRVIASSPAEVQPVFEAITDSAIRLFSAWAAAVFRYEGQLISMAAARGGLPGSADAVMARLRVPHAPTEERPEDRTALPRTIQHIVDVDNDMSWGPRYREDARARGFRSYVAVPMLSGDVVVGVISVSRQRVGGFAPGEISLLQTFADQAVIAIENVRLFNETKEALERQTATTDILRVISSSPTDVQPVFDAIIGNAVPLCDALYGMVWRYEDGLLDLVGHHNLPPEEVEAIRRVSPRPIAPGAVLATPILEGAVLHIPDVEHYSTQEPDSD